MSETVTDPAAAASAAEPPSLFDVAGDGAPPPAPDGKASRPDWLPEQFWNATDNTPNVESLAKSWRDFRGQVSRGEHKPPETPDAYTLPKVEGIPETVGGKDDPLWAEVRGAAHAAGVTQKQLEQIAAPYLKHVAEQLKAQGADAKPDPAAEAEAIRAAHQAEIGKLGPNGTAVVRDVKAWLGGLETRGVLNKAEISALASVSTAEGVRALAKLRELAGEKPIPVTAIDDNDPTEADAKRMMIDGFAKKDDGLVAKGRAIIQRLEAAGKLAPR